MRGQRHAPAAMFIILLLQMATYFSEILSVLMQKIMKLSVDVVWMFVRLPIYMLRKLMLCLQCQYFDGFNTFWAPPVQSTVLYLWKVKLFFLSKQRIYEGWNFNSGNYLFTTDTK